VWSNGLAGVPIWAVALGVAIAAPWLVRLVQLGLEQRLHRRTAKVIAAAQSEVPDPPANVTDEPPGTARRGES
jgi:hypothetical protein